MPRITIECTLHKVRGNRGFTLIELLIVVAIIGILAAIAIPQFVSYRTKSYNSSALTDLRNIQMGEEAYFTENNTYVTVATTTGPTKIVGLLTGASLAKDVYTEVVVPTTGIVTLSGDYWAKTLHQSGNKCYSASAEESLGDGTKNVGVTAFAACPPM